MKLVVETEFLCSYYFHAAKHSSEELLKHKLPHSLYHGLSALIMWQCVFESYANFQIRKHGLGGYMFKRRNGKFIELEDGSIKEKWIHLPVARCRKHFTLNTQPFQDLATIVDTRNALVHFNVEKIKFEKEAPAGARTLGELQSWMKSGEFLDGSIFHTAVCCALAGESTVRRMFQEYSNLTGDPLPDFLTGHEIVLEFRTVGEAT